ncbi:quinohemoprotein amine dehydrogenase subunit alpha [Marinobacterium sp. OS208]|nr:quinohemoprotein amine dehydrogenase subunit alpha [Marinobacterium sedimentorum]MCP8686468.1 quinohemoprotein amine dehydrogenase subunit alpha [Marinobacterium sedimentorum]
MTKQNKKRVPLVGPALALVAVLAAPAMAAQPDGETIIRNNCLACHSETGDKAAPFSRISEQRKTPEGWRMTINRMQALRGAKISPEDKRALIQYLADNQGLAPTEAEPYRYLLEQDTNRVEEGIDEGLGQMCARCHSGARFSLQRRSEDEWKRLVDFHMGQFPTIEFHSLARDRAWYDIAKNETAVELGKNFPLITPQWNSWKTAPKADLTGRWRVLGFVPGKGQFDAWMNAAKSESGYQLQLEGQYADGSKLSGSGNARVYTGYEWRAALTIDGVKMRQVMAADAKGGEMAGRMFPAAERAIGGELRAVRDQGEAEVIAVMPSLLRQGESAELTILGQHLEGDVSLGEGIEIEKVLERDDDSIRVLARATGSEGARSPSVGSASLEGGLSVYQTLARVEVVPANALTRIGGNGGEMEKVRAVYRAVGYSAGADGKAGTEDDLRLGYMPATWSIKPADEVAAHDKDEDFAGSIDAHGIFTPGDAGPNPARKMSANNVGRLTVIASVNDGDAQVRGEGSMLVSVPDFVRRVLD